MVSPRVLATGATAVALSLGGSAPVAAQPSAPANVPALLALPASPGTIARLVEHAGHVDVQQRLSEALTHSDPTVRAAAARVVFVVGLRGLVPRLAEVLVSESQPDPAIELTRALANFGGPEHDGVIDGAAVRLGSRPGVRVASVFAAARGADALAALPRFRAADGGRAVAALIRAARPGGAGGPGGRRPRNVRPRRVRGRARCRP